MFFVSVTSTGLSLAVSLLFATLAGRHISVASKALRGIVGSGLDRVRDRVGAGQWTVVGKEKKGEWGMGNRGQAKEWGERAARIVSANHMAKHSTK